MVIDLKITPANDMESEKMQGVLNKLGFAYTKLRDYYTVPCPDQEWFDEIKQQIQNATDAKAEYTTF